MKRTLQAAVVIAVAATVPAAWSAGGKSSVQVSNVAAGNAVISQAGAVTTIRTMSHNTIINYQRLDVLSGQTLKFLQPNSTSRVLNRIQGAAPSKIDGTITSNGIVYIVNPAGVMFGKGAVVNVGQFFAAAAHLTDQNFLHGVNQFTDSAGRVQNDGTITANQVHLIGQQVGNSGAIVTDGSAGIVTMTSGKDVYIGEVTNPAASPSILVKVSGQATTPTGPAVQNTGTINAGKGQVLLGAGDVYGVAISNSGGIKGRTITLDGNGQGMVIAGGTLDAASKTGHGGNITILGEKVGVTGTLDASGASAGGDIRIGGDFHGGGTLRAADKTTITSDAVIKADATGNGNGGTVVVWSVNGTRYYGSISAKGTGARHTGGSVEVSGGILDFAGSVTLTGPGGTGTLLLDPDTLNIETAGTDDALVTGDLAFADLTPTVSLSPAKIVTLLSTASLSLQANNLIDVKNSIDASGTPAANGAKLTLEVLGTGLIKMESGVSIKTRNGDIEIKGPLQLNGGTALLNAGTGAILLDNPTTESAASGLTLTGDTVTISGSVTIGGALSVTSNSTATDLSIANDLTASAITLTTGKSLVNTAVIDTSASNGAVTIRAAGINLSGGTITAGTGTVNLFQKTASQAINLGSGGSFQIAAADLASITAATIVIGESGVQSGTITSTTFDASAITTPIVLNSNSGAGKITLDDNGTATALKVGGDLTMNAGTGGITAASSTNTFAEIAAAGTITMSSGGIVGSSTKRIQFASGQTDIGITAASDIFVAGLGSIGFTTVTATAGDLDILTAAASAGNITATGPLSGSTITLKADGGIGTVVQRVQFAANQTDITLTAGGDIDIDGVGNLTFLTVTSTGGAIDISTQGTGNILGSGNFSASTTATLDAGGNIGTSGSPIKFVAGQTGVTLTAGSSIDVRGLGDLTLTSATATTTLAVTTLSNGDINATGTLAGTTINLNADGGIGTAATVTLNPSSTVTLTTSGNGALGDINISTGSGALNTPAITLNGTAGQTVTLDGGAITLGTTDLSGADLVITGTSLTVTAGTTVTADSVSAALTAGVSVPGTFTVAGDFKSTGTTFTVGGTITVTGSGDIYILHTGAVSIGGTLTASGDSIRIAGSSITETAGASVTAGELAVRASGGGAAIAMTQTNTVGTFGAVVAGSGGSVAFKSAGALNFNTITGIVAALPFPAFAAVSGITTNNGNATVTSGGTLTVSNAVAAGTGTVKLFATSGDVDVNSALSGAAVNLAAAADVSVAAAVTANNAGSGSFSSSGVNFDITAAGSMTTDGAATLVHTGLVGLANNFSADTLNILGKTITQTAGTVTATNLGVQATGSAGGTGTITLGTVTINAGGKIAATTVSGKTISITSSTGFAIGTASSTTALDPTGATVNFTGFSGVNSGAGTASLTATTGDITGSQTVTATTVTLAASAGAIGTSAVPIAISATTINLTSGGAGSAGNIFVSTGGGALLTSNLSITTPGTGQTVSLATGAFTVDANLDLTGDDLQIGATSFALNSGKSLTEENFKLVSAGAVTLAGTLDVGDTALLSGTTIIQSGGALNALSLATYTTSANGSNESVKLTAGTNAIGIFASSSTAAGGSVTMTSTTGFSVGSFGASAASGGVGGLASLAGVTTNNGVITLAGAGTSTISSAVNSGTAATSLITTSGDLVLNASVTGTAIRLSAANDIDINTTIAGGSSTFKAWSGNAFNLNSGSITAGATTIISGGIALAANVNATTLSLQADAISQTAGLINVTNLGVRSTLGSFTLGNVTLAAAGQLAAVAPLNQSITITTTGSIKIGAIGSSTVLDASGATVTFSAISGVTTTGLGATSLTASTGNITGTAVDSVTGTIVNITATTGAIGSALTGLLVDAGAGTYTSGASGSAGDIHLTSTGLTLGALTFVTDTASVQTITIDAAGALTLNGSILTNNDDLVIHAATSGIGNLAFGPAITLTAPNITLWAGIGDGSLAASLVNIVVLPTLSGSSGLTIRQDAAISDAGINGSLFTNYTLRSDGGNVTVTTAASVAGTNLTLTAKTSGLVTINSALSLNSLVSNGTTHLAGGVTSTNDQDYNGNVVIDQNSVLDGANLTFTGTIDSAASASKNLTLTASGLLTLPDSIGAASNGALGIFIVNGAATGTMTLGSGISLSVNTTGSQSYSLPITLQADTALNNTSAGAITLNATVDGTQSLEVNSVGNEVFNFKLGVTATLTSLTTDSVASGLLGGQVIFNYASAGTADSSVKTSGAQLYRDAASLGANTTLLSATAANITFNSTINGAHALIVNTGGTTTFGGFVGGSTALTSVVTSAGGSTHVNGGGVTTTGIQNFGDDVVVGADAVFTSTANADITFGGTLDGAFNVTVNTGGTTTFTGVVGATTPLTGLTTDGAGNTIFLNLSSSSTGDQIFNDPVTLTVDTVITTGPAGLVRFDSTIDGAFNLDIFSAGTTTFQGAVGATTPLTRLTVTSADTIFINGGSIHTTGIQSYSNAVVLGAGTTLTSTGAGAAGNITFDSTIDGGQTLAINTQGKTTFSGLVGGTGPLTSLTTDTGGSTAINGGGVTTTGLQTYNDAVTIGTTDATLASTGGAAITFVTTVDGPKGLTVNTTGNTTFSGLVGATTALNSLTTNAGGETIIKGGAITTATTQTFNDAVFINTLDATLTSNGAAALGNITFNSNLDGPAALTVDTAGTTTFNGMVGNFSPLDSLTTDATGSTAINGGVILTINGQSFGDAVTIGTTDASLISISSGDITLSDTVDGPKGLIVSTAGTTTFSGLVGGTTALNSLTADGGGNTAINGGGVTTVATQSYFDTVTIGAADATLQSTSAGNITFNFTVNGPKALTVNTSGTTTFNGLVGGSSALDSLTTDATGNTVINGGAITTVNFQTYNDAVTLPTADATLASTSSGDITFATTVDGPRALTVNTSGATIFTGFVGGTTALASLTTNAGGSTQISGGGATTTGAQTFNDPVTITTLDAILTSTAGSAITFADTLDGPKALTVNTTGATIFTGLVGGTTSLDSLTTNAGGSTQINGGGVTTVNFQTYNDAVTITTTAATLVSTAAGNITFATILDGPQALTISTAGITQLLGAVGNVTPLASLTTDAPGSTDINGGLVITTGLQLYADDVVLSADAAVTSTSGAAVTFSKTINGAFALTVNTAGLTSFLGAVGNTTPLASLTTDAPGATDINGGVINTSGFQFYGDDVVLSADAILTSTGAGTLGNITFDKTLNGPFSITVNTAGTTTFNGVVGGVTNLINITTDAPGTTVFNNAPATTTGDQDFLDDVVFTTDIILTTSPTGFVHFHKTVNGLTPGGQSLTIFSATNTIFDGAVGNLTPLHDLTVNHFGALGGTIQINGGVVNTTGVQAYNYAVVLGADAVLTSTGAGAAGNITFASTVDGAHSLTVNTAGVTHFAGAVGGITPLTSLITDAAGSTDINGTSINTTLDQTFNDDVTLSADTVLTSSGAGDITFAKTVNNGFTLTVDTSGTTTFGGVVGGTAALTSVTTDAGGTTAINGGAITTTGLQLFNDAVTLGADTTLNSTASGNITFITTVNGAHALAVNTAGATTFGGAVGGSTALTSVTTNAAGATVISGGAITTTGLQLFNDPVTLATLNAVLTSTASGNITFITTVNGAKALTVNTSGTTTFGGVVGGSTALTSVTTDAGGSTAINGGGITTTSFQTFNDAVTLASLNAVLASTAAGNITFAATVNGARALAVNTAGITTFGGVVGGTTALTSLTTDAPGSTQINGGAITTTTTQRFNDPTTLGAATVLTAANSVLNGSAVFFASSLNSSVSPRDLTINNAGSAGNVTFAGPSGNLLTIGDLRVLGPVGKTNITGPMHVNSLTLVNSLSSTGAIISANTVSVAGSSTINGSLTSVNSTITLSGPAVVNGSLDAASDITTGGQLTLAGTVHSSAGNVAVGGTLQVNSGTVAAVVGNITVALHAFVTGNLTAGQAITINHNFTEHGTVSAGTNVTVHGLLNLTAGSITAHNNLSVAGASTANGSVRAVTGNIALTGPATLNGILRAGNNITLGGASTLNGTLTAGGNISAPGPVTLGNGVVATAGGTGGITLGAINGAATSSLQLITTGAATNISGPLITVGAIGGPRTRIGDLEFDSSFVVRLGGDIFAGAVTFAGANRGDLVTPPLVATISHDSGSLLIDTAGAFTMKQGQKLSVFDKSQLVSDASFRGSLSIISHNNPIQIGDLSASGQITVDSGSVLQIITIVARPGGQYVDSKGAITTDHGTDIVSGAPGPGAITLVGTLELLVPANVKSTDLVQFAAPLGSSSLNPSLTLRFNTTNPLGVKVLTQNQVTNSKSTDFEAADFTTSGTVLDQVALGVGNPISSVGSVFAQGFQILAPERNQAISGALKDALQELGIFARDLRTDELVEFLIGRALYDDVPYKLNPSPQDNQVASNRLPYSPVVPTVDAYRALFLKSEVDANGKAVLDEHGKQKIQAQDTTIKNAFGQAWQMYSKEKKEAATPDGFRGFLETNEKNEPKFVTALGYLDKLRDLLVQIKSLGLTDTEFEVSMKVLLAKARPANIKEGDFLNVVMGASTRSTGHAVARLSSR